MGSIFLLLFSLFAVGVLIFFLRPIPLPQIPGNILSEADMIWKKHMLEGIGAYYTSSGEYRSPLYDVNDSFRQDISNALLGKSSVQINSERFAGDYMIMQGGPIDIIESSSVEYVLYGREVGQWHMPNKLAWNNEYYFSHADFYLIKRNSDTKVGEVVREWLNVPNSYGHLLYDPATKLITIDLCAIGAEQIKVEDELPVKNSGYGGLNLVCTSS